MWVHMCEMFVCTWCVYVCVRVLCVNVCRHVHAILCRYKNDFWELDLTSTLSEARSHCFFQFAVCFRLAAP